jgi:hypothetical protein
MTLMPNSPNNKWRHPEGRRSIDLLVEREGAWAMFCLQASTASPRALRKAATSEQGPCRSQIAAFALSSAQFALVVWITWRRPKRKLMRRRTRCVVLMVSNDKTDTGCIRKQTGQSLPFFVGPGTAACLPSDIPSAARVAQHVPQSKCSRKKQEKVFRTLEALMQAIRSHRPSTPPPSILLPSLVPLVNRATRLEFQTPRSVLIIPILVHSPTSILTSNR